MRTLDAVTLTGNPQIISFPSSLPARQFRLANESAYALRVDIAGSSHWIDPWTADVFMLPQVVTSINVTPSVLTALAVASPSSAVLITLADETDRIPGTYPMSLLRQTTSFSNRQQLTPTIASVNGTASQTYTPPFGTHALNILVSDTTKVTSIKVTGTTSGVIYVNYTAPTAPNPFVIPVETGVDVAYTIAVVGTATGATIYTVAILDVEVVGVQQSSTALSVSLIDFFTSGAINSDGSSGKTNLAVSERYASPAPWQSPTATATANTVLVHGTTQTLITGVGGQKIYVHQIHLIFSAAPPNPITFKESGGLSFRVVAPGAGVPQGPYIWDLKGMAMPIGNSFQISNGSATDVGLQCQVDYAQL